MRAGAISLLLCFSSSFALAAPGFKPSHDPNVFMLKGRTSGATAFLLDTPTLGKVLLTQVHVIKNLGSNLTLRWGEELGPFYRVVRRDADSFKLAFRPEVIWKSDELDIVVMRAPSDLLAACQCTGLNAKSYQSGPARLLGYPITGRRIFPKTGQFLSMVGELFGHVSQQQSQGKTWQEEAEYLADMDVLPGSSGGPILDQEGDVIGIIHTSKTWYGIGYQYRNPSLNFVPIEDVFRQMSEDGIR
jgi:hypothetical protein